MIEADGALEFGASVDVSAAASGLGGRVVASAIGDADVSGSWATAGGDSSFSLGDLFLEGCRVRVSGALVNAAVKGRNRIVAHESVSISPSGSIKASGDGAGNSIRYRRASRPPLLDGLVLPSASLEVDTTLSDCPACGNAEFSNAELSYAELGNGESCDDGDFCSLGGTCFDGTCMPSFAPSLSPTSLKIRLGRSLGRSQGRDRVAWKGEFPAELLTVSPSVSSVRMVLVDALSRVILDASLPAGSFQGGEGSWRFRAAEASADGIVKSSIETARLGDIVRARVKLRGVDLGGLDLGGASSAETLSLALLVGDEPATALCTSSGKLLCARGRAVVSCESAP